MQVINCFNVHLIKDRDVGVVLQGVFVAPLLERGDRLLCVFGKVEIDDGAALADAELTPKMINFVEIEPVEIAGYQIRKTHPRAQLGLCKLIR